MVKIAQIPVRINSILSLIALLRLAPYKRDNRCEHCDLYRNSSTTFYIYADYHLFPFDGYNQLQSFFIGVLLLLLLLFFFLPAEAEYSYFLLIVD